jgi:hypothetical protein
MAATIRCAKRPRPQYHQKKALTDIHPVTL